MGNLFSDEELLMDSCENENIKKVYSLIEKGEDVNCEDVIGQTPFIIACRTGNKNLVELLINSGSILNHEDDRYFSPIFVASRKGHYNIVKLLIDKGVKLNSKDEEKETVKIMLCRLKDERRCALLLLLCTRKNCDDSSFSEKKLSLDLFKLIIYMSGLIEDPFINKTN